MIPFYVALFPGKFMTFHKEIPTELNAAKFYSPWNVAIREKANESTTPEGALLLRTNSNWGAILRAGPLLQMLQDL